MTRFFIQTLAACVLLGLFSPIAISQVTESASQLIETELNDPDRYVQLVELRTRFPQVAELVKQGNRVDATALADSLRAMGSDIVNSVYEELKEYVEEKSEIARAIEKRAELPFGMLRVSKPRPRPWWLVLIPVIVKGAVEVLSK